jgi:ribulose 1,5-bisphosphate synthetase/thiazole synthase
MKTYERNEAVDVVSVGAGPASATAAKRLAESDFGVVVIERGEVAG